MTDQSPPKKLALPLGEFLCAAGLAQPAQVEAALQSQSNSGKRLGEALVNQDQLDAKDMAAVLAVQKQLRQSLVQDKKSLTHSIPECLRIGELLVARGDVARTVLDQALKQQKPGWRLGDVLLQMGAINEATLDRVLPLQKRLLSAVLCAGIGFVFAFAAPKAEAGGDSTRLTISATVATSLRVQMKNQPTQFVISAQDIARGYLDIEQGSVLGITTNSAEGVALEFHGTDSGAGIEAVQVMGGTGAFRMPAQGGILLLQGGWRPQIERNVQLRYRLLLGPQSQAGNYAWPFVLGVSAL
jgi:hypothetical protein